MRLIKPATQGGIHNGNRTRNGHTLVELLVALPLGALLATVAIAMLLNAHQLTRRVESSTGMTRELRHAGAIVAADIRPLSADDIHTWSDTAIEFDAAIASGIVCATPSATVIELLPTTADDAARTTWNSTPQPGDRVLAVESVSAPVPDNAPAWQQGVLQSMTMANGCTNSPLKTIASDAVTRLTLAAPIAAPTLGSPLRIQRRTRLSLYKSSDNFWYLGRRTLTTSGWDIIQPAAGPLKSARDGGLRIQLRDESNNPLLPGALTPPASVSISMRANSTWKQASGAPGAADSLSLHVTLRGNAP